MTVLPEPSARAQLRDLSPVAHATALWLRYLARGLRTFRLYRGENPVSTQLRDSVAEGLERIVAEFGPLDLRIGSTEIVLDGERVVKPSKDPDLMPDPVESLPFLFYRDGVRRLRVLKEVPREEIFTLIDALTLAGVGPNTQDDLVTLLWQGNLSRIVLETAPLEQAIYLTAQAPEGGGGGGPSGQSYLLQPGGAEIRGDLGQTAGPQGLHRDTFDDWQVPDQAPDAVDVWSRSYRPMEAALDLYLERYRAETEQAWDTQVGPFMRRLLALDPSELMRCGLVRSVVTWVGSSLQRCAWDETQTALGLLRELDPDGRRGEEDLASAMAGLDLQLVTERLDSAEAEDHSRFAAIVTALGRPALGLAIGVMARSEKVRVRAAACTALTYLCGDEPALLKPYVEDSRWEVARNTVFVLGQIGGAEVAPLLRAAASNPESRVRRMVVQAAGNVPRDYRLPILEAQLDSRDPQVLAATLNMLTRERSAKVARAILNRIEAPDFEARSEDNQRALFNALAEVADDSVVGPLEQLLNKGGWFARRTLERVAAARTLRRIGSGKAVAALEAGLRSRVEAVRAACLDALSMRMSV